MKITYAPDLIAFLKNKNLLLDTNVFRDFSSGPKQFAHFINNLKDQEVTIATIDAVKIELLTGSADERKYKDKEVIINSLIDVTIPISQETQKTIFQVISLYGIEGAGVSITDITLGALLKQYGDSVCLMSRDIKAFSYKIFKLLTVVNAVHGKGIFTYGIYQYNNAEEPPESELSNDDIPF